eukprot:TRINITY_DN62338_c0_g1_i1.p1 TRINITY_DN62338_c0_g1~~TRINITY_DN62338_c0_g1_i1.p1  ORF type:complete len:519 (-),score=73.77 TRINITY_DN62338_c0_g1_i1:16-1572(-)
MGGAMRQLKTNAGNRDSEELENITGTGSFPTAAEFKTTCDKVEGEEKSDLTGEYGNIFLLLLLYTLQGVPMGLSSVLPLIMKERDVSFSQLATFSLNSYPFSLKILWAPIVDTAYSERFGRRKTWMVPAQLLIGLIMLFISTVLDKILFVEKPDVNILTVLFFCLYFLCATQDIAVDGWALTMLRRENVGYAATCNSVGQTLGYAVGFTGFMVLEQFKLMTLSAFMAVWGVAFIFITLAVALLKREGPEPKTGEPEIDVAMAYKSMLAMLRLRAVQSLIGILFTWKACFAVVDSVTPLKIQEKGMPKEHMAYMTSLVMPVYILLPIVITRWTSSSQPLELAVSSYKWRVAIIPIMACLVYGFPASAYPTPWAYYFIIFIFSLLSAVVSQCMFVSQMAFFARVSDPAMGGTYMTLMNTLANLGGMWPGTFALKFVDMTSCSGKQCVVQADGYYVLAAASVAFGVFWCVFGLPKVQWVQQLKLSEWRVAVVSRSAGASSPPPVQLPSSASAHADLELEGI